MGGSDKTLVLTRRLSLVILIGFIGIAASPFTSLYSPMYPMYLISEYNEQFTLNDEFPMFEFVSIIVDKLVIEELTTNGSPVVINLYSPYDSEYPAAIIQNVTEIRDVFLVGISSEESRDPVFRITRDSNQSVQMTIRLRSWRTYPSTDYLVSGPSILLVLALPLLYVMYKNRGFRPDARGYAMICMILVSAILMAPLLVYTYNHGGAPIRHDLVQEVRTHEFQLNASNPFLEFTESIESGDPDTFVRIANFTTNDVLVAITIIPEGVTEGVELQIVTNISSSLLQFELPRENLTGFTVQLNRIAEDVVVVLSVERVRDVWTPWIDPMLYYLSCTAGLTLMVIVLVFPQKSESPSSV